MVQLLIQNENTVFEPILEDGLSWKTERVGVPGQITFKLIQDDILKIEEGNAVSLKVANKEVFYGFIFTIDRTKGKSISITAYDQLRYLKNKDTYVYTNKTASEVIKMIASDFQLNIGTLENTNFKIASRVEENEELFEMIKNALDITLQNKGKMYVLYDDFGKLTLKNIESMLLNVLIDEETAGDFSYKSSIDTDVYNKIKLTYDNEKTGKREVYIAKDSSNINKWGILQYFNTLQNGENGKAKADALLQLYNRKKKNLQVKNILGDLRVRAGSLIPVSLNLGDNKILQLMIVERCTHTFKNNEHFMDLTLKGSDFDV